MDSSTNTPHRRLRLYGPSLLTLALLLPFFAFYIRQVKSEQGYLNDHSFRVLDVMAQQFAASVNGAHETMEAAILLPRQEKYFWKNGNKPATVTLDAAGAVREIQSYLTTYITDGDVSVQQIKQPANRAADDSCLESTSSDDSDAEKHSIERAEDSQVYIQLRHQSQAKGVKNGPLWVEIKTQIYPAKMIVREVGNDPSEMFETVFVATKGGRVLAHSSDSRVDVSHVQALLESRQIRDIVEGTKSAKGSDSTLSANQESEISGVEQRFDVQVAGTDYVLFAVPAPLLLVDPEVDAHKPTELAFYGLIRKEGLDTKALQLPLLGMPAIAVAFVISMAFLWPMLKLYTMSDRERLTKSSVASMCGVTVIATLLLASLYLAFGFELAQKTRSNRELEELALRLKEHFAAELGVGMDTSRDVIKHLNKLYEEAKFRSAWPTESRFPIAALDSGSYCRYPFLKHTVLTGHQPDPACPENTPFERQIVKVSASGFPTPLIPLPPSKFPFVSWLYNSPSLFQRKPGQKGALSRERFVIESFVSPNTGQFIPILFFPEQPGQSDERLSWHVMLSTQLPSLVNVVFPPGFGFALVNENGTVEFDSDPSRNLRENFLRECQNPADLKEALKFKQKRILNLNYGGGKINAFVLPFDGDTPSWTLSRLGLSLIVYCDQEQQDRTVFEVGRVFLAAVIGLPLLVVLSASVVRLLMHAFRRPANITFVQKRIWPWEKDKAAYVEEGLWGLACFVSAVVMALVFPPVWVPWVLDFILAICLCGFVHSFVSKGVVHSRLTVKLVERVPLSSAFAARVFGVGIGVIGILSILVFQLVLTNEQERQDKADYRTLRMALEKRTGRIVKDYQAIGYRADASGEDPQHGKAPWLDLEKFCEVRVKSGFDIYDHRGLDRPRVFKVLGFNWLKLPFEEATDEPPPTCPPYRDPSFGVDLTAGVHKSDQHSEPLAQFERGELWKALPRPFSGDLPSRAATLGYYLAGLLLLVPIFLWLRLIIRRLFILDFNEPEPLPLMTVETLRATIEGALRTRPEKLERLLIFAHPQSGSGVALDRVVAELKQHKAVPGKFHVFDFGGATGVEAGDAAQLRQALVESSAASRIAILDNFEVQITDADKRAEKLAMLEELIFSHHSSVYILTSADPLLLMESLLRQGPSGGALQAEMDRWSRVLASFNRCIFDDDAPKAGFRRAVSDVIYEGLAYPLTNTEAIEMPEIFREELSPTIFMRRAAARIKVNELKFTSSREFEESLVAQVTELADGYYRVIWMNCTSDERLALYQLGKDDWLNPLNRVAISHLLRKQLIRKGAASKYGSGEEYFHYDPHRDGAYHLMNLSFRDFVLATVSLEELAIWAKQQNLSIWPALRTALVLTLIVVALFFAYVRQDLFGQYFSYFAALAGGGAALIRLVMQYFTKTDPGVAAVLGVGGKTSGGESG